MCIRDSLQIPVLPVKQVHHRILQVRLLLPVKQVHHPILQLRHKQLLLQEQAMQRQLLLLPEHQLQVEVSHQQVCQPYLVLLPPHPHLLQAYLEALPPRFLLLDQGQQVLLLPYLVQLPIHHPQQEPKLLQVVLQEVSHQAQRLVQHSHIHLPQVLYQVRPQLVRSHQQPVRL